MEAESQNHNSDWNMIENRYGHGDGYDWNMSHRIDLYSILYYTSKHTRALQREEKKN
jgi:hypothetical protein